jgi:hypothetical protein
VRSIAGYVWQNYHVIKARLPPHMVSDFVREPAQRGGCAAMVASIYAAAGRTPPPFTPFPYADAAEYTSENSSEDDE